MFAYGNCLKFLPFEHPQTSLLTRSTTKSEPSTSTSNIKNFSPNWWKMPSSTKQKLNPEHFTNINSKKGAPKNTTPATTTSHKPSPEHSTSIAGNRSTSRKTTSPNTTTQTEKPVFINRNICLLPWFHMNTIPSACIIIFLSSCISPSPTFPCMLQESSSRDSVVPH